MSLIGQIAIVTGAAKGMGRGIAERLAQDGAKIVVCDCDEAGAEETVRCIIAGGNDALAVIGDMRNVADISKLFQTCNDRFGRPDILVANAGISRGSTLETITEEEYYAVHDLNVKGTLFCLKEAAKHLKDGGRIVVISSSTTRFPLEGMALYASSKAAQKLMVEVAAQELANRGITVNSVMPGLTETPTMLANLPVEFMQEVIEASPFKRLGKPQDIAEVVAFLVNKNSQWVSGQHILVNGGSRF